jgi:hypothetical protein
LTSLKNKVLVLLSYQGISNFGIIIKERGFYFDCLINNAALGTDYGITVPSAETA